MSLNVGYGSLIQEHQREPGDMGLNPPLLDPISLTEDEAQERCDLMEQRQGDVLRCIPAGLPPATLLAHHLADVSANSSAVAVVKDFSLKLHHVMSVKQSLRKDLTEHSYQFSCRAAAWSKMSFGHVPMQFEPVELRESMHQVNKMRPITFNSSKGNYGRCKCHARPSGRIVDSSSS